MKLLALIFGLIASVVLCMNKATDTSFGPSANLSDTSKEMYVINAMVYQVGILTNKTDNETSNNNTTGNQEAITFFHTNGTEIDLSKIPKPLLTNVTVQSLVGVAPTPVNKGSFQVPWATLDNLTLQPPESHDKIIKNLTEDGRNSNQNPTENRLLTNNSVTKILLKRNIASDESTPVKIVKGTAAIPQDAHVQSIALPPLLALNNNFNIPVPIPNTSVVHYAKINTIVHKP